MRNDIVYVVPSVAALTVQSLIACLLFAREIADHGDAYLVLHYHQSKPIHLVDDAVVPKRQLREVIPWINLNGIELRLPSLLLDNSVIGLSRTWSSIQIDQAARLPGHS